MNGTLFAAINTLSNSFELILQNFRASSMALFGYDSSDLIRENLSSLVANLISLSMITEHFP